MNHIYEEEHMYVYEVGMQNPDRCWINSDRDVWYRNPHYSGPEQPHPEFGELYEPPAGYKWIGSMPLQAPPLSNAVFNPKSNADYPDDIPF